METTTYFGYSIHILKERDERGKTLYSVCDKDGTLVALCNTRQDARDAVKAHRDRTTAQASPQGKETTLADDPAKDETPNLFEQDVRADILFARKNRPKKPSSFVRHGKRVYR